MQEGDLFARRYRIVHEIGRGGMGRVFRAHDQELGIDVAIKVIRPEFLDDERMVKRFKNELLLARQVSHENVVRIHDFSEFEGIKYITMQFVDGKTLRQHLTESGPLTITEVEDLALQICAGLSAARKKEIAHRDLKPQNILIDQKGQAYIADFGLAKSLGQSGLSVSGVILGTPEYIAPEQWRGKRGDYRSDIYSLGVLLYEIVTARPLFTAETELGYLQKHINETPAFASGEKRAVPDYLRAIILRCLAKDPDDRYQDAGDIARDIKAHRATAMPLGHRLKHRIRQVALPLGLLVFVTAGGWLLWRNGQNSATPQEPSRSLVVLPFANNTGEERYAFWGRTLADLLTTDLGQSRHIRVASQAQVQAFFAKYPDWTPGKPLSDEQRRVLSQETAVQTVLLGELNQAGRRFRISGRLISLKSGEIRATYQTDGLGEESIFSMIDGMTDKTKLAFNLSRDMILQEIDRDIRQITTPSIEALKAYSSAKEYHHLAQFQEAVNEYNRAIELDPQFAMAYAGAASTMGNYRDPRLREYYEKALSLSDHISKRERLLIEGQYLNAFFNDYRKALARFLEILTEYPDDGEALEMVATLNRNLENWAESDQAYKKMEQVNPSRVIISANLFGNAMMQGRFSEARDILDRYENELKQTRRYHYSRFHLFFSQGIMDEAENELSLYLNEAGKTPHYLGMMGNLKLLRGRLQEAEDFYRSAWEALPAPHLKDRILSNLVNLSRHRGRFTEALGWIDGLMTQARAVKDQALMDGLTFQRLTLMADRPGISERRQARIELERRLDSWPKDGNRRDRFDHLYLLGRMKLAEDPQADLTAITAEMDELTQAIGEARARYPLHLRALAALGRGQFQEAENFYHQAHKLFPNPQTCEGIPDFPLTLARIKTAQGEHEEAMALYEAMINRNQGRMEAADVFVSAHAELARLQMINGRLSQAQKTAAKVQDWWDGGDWAPQVLAEMREIAKTSPVTSS
jgi:tetratricopeptide (TPR) repeat protein